MAGPTVAARGHRAATASSSSTAPGSNRMSGLATSAQPDGRSASPAFAAGPYPTLPPVGSTRTDGYRSAARSGAPSVEPLSARTTSTGRLVATASELRKPSSASPGEYVTATTRSGCCSGDVPTPATLLSGGPRPDQDPAARV